MNEAKTEHFKKTTLRELGAQLPVVRRLQDGTPIKDNKFSFLEWDMQTEEKLGELKSKSKSVGDFVSNLLGMLLADFCGKDFQALSKEERIITLNQLEFPNVMYLYIYLRVEELGEELRLDVQCPHCGHMNKDFVCSLMDMDVKAKEESHERQVNFDLKKPILFGDKTITGLKLDVAKWDTMEKADPETAENDAKIKQLLFRSAIVGAFEGHNKPITAFVDVENLVKKLKKVDIERLAVAIATNNAGPALAIKGNCVKCKKEWFKGLNWSYDYFFDSSSL